MLNRKVEVKVVKNDKNADAVPSTESFAAKLGHTKEAAKELAVGGAAIMCLYILMDTFRQVAVANASK